MQTLILKWKILSSSSPPFAQNATSLREIASRFSFIFENTSTAYLFIRTRRTSTTGNRSNDRPDQMHCWLGFGRSLRFPNAYCTGKALSKLLDKLSVLFSLKTRYDSTYLPKYLPTSILLLLNLWSLNINKTISWTLNSSYSHGQDPWPQYWEVNATLSNIHVIEIPSRPRQSLLHGRKRNYTLRAPDKEQ